MFGRDTLCRAEVPASAMAVTMTWLLVAEAMSIATLSLVVRMDTTITIAMLIAMARHDECPTWHLHGIR